MSLFPRGEMLQQENPTIFMPIVVWYSIRNCGDGSASLQWALSKKEVEWDQEDQNDYEGWAEDCYGQVETFIGSKTYNDAVEGSKQLAEYKAERKEEKRLEKEAENARKKAAKRKVK